ncbi:MAG: ABC transporter permease [Oscillospiraceae bacterium]|nr:ABC transporter permease [Oscillospiraceae bacterium]
MKLIQALRMSIKAIMSKKARSFLTMLGIIIGVAAVVVLTSLTQAQNEMYLSQFRRMGDNTLSMYAYAWRQTKLPGEISDFVKTELADLTVGVTPEIQAWGKIVYESKTIEDSRILLGSSDYSVCYDYKIDIGRDISHLDIIQENNVVVLGSRIKDVLFNFRDPIGQYITIVNGQSNKPVKFEVVGVYKQRQGNQQWSLDDMILAPYTQMRALTGPWQQVDSYVLKAKDIESAGDIKEKLESFLAGKIGDDGWYSVNISNEWIDSLEEMNRSQTIVLAGIAAISLIVGGIGIMNIMLVTVTERTREIGIRKAIGAERRSIIAQFLIEASVLSSIGGLLGVLFGFLITLFWGKMTFNILVLPWWPMTIAAMGFALVMGIGFGLYPAAKASRLQPVVALRNE